jgi:uncharacterized protein (DUF2062 family)
MKILRTLLQLDETPHRAALSFAIGVYIAFFPVWGIHTLMALGIALLFRLNRSAIVLGAWINNPWTVAPLYTVGTLVGCALLGVPTDGLRAIDWGHHGPFWTSIGACLRPYLWSFVVGNTVVGILAALLSYPIVRTALHRRAVGGPAAAKA